jgi:hypothetical protein
MFANPELLSPGYSSITDPTLLATVDDYKVALTSPVVNAGLALEAEFGVNPGIQDYFGNEIKQGPEFDMGVHELVDPNWQNQELSFKEGWNLISFRVVPQDSDLMQIFQPLIDSGVLKKVMDEEGNTIEDWGTFGGWKNGIGDVVNTEGYKVNVETDATLSVDGYAVVLAYEIPLKAGWNIISWPSANEQDGMEVMQALIDGGQLKKVMDEEGNTIEDWGAFGGWKNFIDNFKPGEGYKVNVSSACTLTINENIAKSELIVQKSSDSDYFMPAFTGNGNDHMNINLVNLTESGISEGDEIGVFDGDICVGSVKIEIPGYLSETSSISVPVSSTDSRENKNGFTDGNSISIKLYRNGAEYPLILNPLNNSGTVFEKGSSLFAKLSIVTGLNQNAKTDSEEIKCYPNPFNERVYIDANLKDNNSEVSLGVYNQMGQFVKLIVEKQNMSSGFYQFNWDGINENNQKVPPGIYYIKISVDDVNIHRKVVLAY